MAGSELLPIDFFSCLSDILWLSLYFRYLYEPDQAIEAKYTRTSLVRLSQGRHNVDTEFIEKETMSRAKQLVSVSSIRTALL
ncbi:hypothetical protein LguiB_036122 [Lonicera macranthoides]